MLKIFSKTFRQPCGLAFSKTSLRQPHETLQKCCHRQVYGCRTIDVKQALDKQELLGVPNNFNEKNLIISAGDINSLSNVLVHYSSSRKQL